MGTGPALVFRDRCLQFSQALRGYEVWVALPSPGTREQLRARLADAVFHLAVGDYAELPTVDETNDRVTTLGPAARRARIISAIRSTLSALGPLLGLASLLLGESVLGLSIGNGVKGAFFVAGVAWLSLNLVTNLDPLYSAKMESMRDLLASAVEKPQSGD
jgi:hypothetical protein